METELSKKKKGNETRTRNRLSWTSFETKYPFIVLHALCPNKTAQRNNIRFLVEEDNGHSKANNRLFRTTFPDSLYAGTSL